MRKIRLFTVIIFLSLIPSALIGEECKIGSTVEGNELIIDISLGSPDIEEMRTHLQDGDQSIIEFELRIYREGKGFKSLFGDILVEETGFSYTGRWDPLQSKYEVAIDGRNIYFDSFSSFLDFFSSYQHRIPLNSHNMEDYYILGRTTVILSKLRPPFGFLAPLMRTLTRQSSWTRTDP